jgi:hypothetical protein
MAAAPIEAEADGLPAGSAFVIQALALMGIVLVLCGWLWLGRIV